MSSSNNQQDLTKLDLSKLNVNINITEGDISYWASQLLGYWENFQMFSQEQIDTLSDNAVRHSELITKVMNDKFKDLPYGQRVVIELKLAEMVGWETILIAMGRIEHMKVLKC